MEAKIMISSEEVVYYFMCIVAIIFVIFLIIGIIGYIHSEIECIKYEIDFRWREKYHLLKR